ncbi:type VI secretion system-associated FHA domain protein TagH [Pseudomonas helleri]|uniref:Type VI secretion system-associated FHA domain protein TagH n=1 Tax=Pseudomonas helleri TaxID=1608996 RepID=A0A6A7YY85_9PSED|nr:type VI secretion system-associated FHA domain protein TagH [Pseudomonas helleri]MQT26412.1 type VI secretion system-associated FHA domain protein TagH [Pseudomonas helleri]MQT81343.1 type VI secretion system-associated FHA domain protein TagH [Pseudomonas helleri]MQU17708.1 type VI secretion system-associated FHA domain protein TagH [Pseudomonas helleri]
MELIFELLSHPSLTPAQVMRKTFDEKGGVIGRNADCTWQVVDSEQKVSKYHVNISYLDGAFYITDTSTNGVQVNGTGTYLIRDKPERIGHGTRYSLHRFEIRAELPHELQRLLLLAKEPLPGGIKIPDDAFMGRDSLDPLEPEAPNYSVFDVTGENGSASMDLQLTDRAPLNYEHLSVPQLMEAAQAPVPQPQSDTQAPDMDGFWSDFGAALGVDVLALEPAGREALAIKAASLLKQTVAGVQQSLWTRSELKNQLRLARTVIPGTRHNPLTSTHDAGEALGLLLAPHKAHQLSAEQAVWRAFRDLQAHQVALLSASRATVRATLEHFSPQQLTLRQERDGHRPWFATAGSRWRAFNRYHQALQQDDDWCERMLARDFAQAYEEQVRLVSTLNNDPQG